MKRKHTVRALALGLALSTVAVLASAGSDAKAQPKPPSLDLIKKLAGDWVALDEHGEPTEEVISTYRVTAGGSAVLEMLFAGTEKEMVTVYHQDGEDLVLTHYCVMGNQPRMRAQPITEEGTLVFKCTGDGGNMRSEDDAHMHQGTIRMIDEDHIDVAWANSVKGVSDYTAKFDLVRKK